MAHDRFRYVSTHSIRPGLFGIKGLQTPEDWLRLAREAVIKCQDIARAIASAKPSVHVIQQLDDISDTVCQVYDAAELCRNVHSETAWRQAAHQTCTNLGGFIHELNNDTTLYSALVRTLDKNSSVGGEQRPGAPDASAAALIGEALLVGRLLRRDFEMAGIHLSEAGRKEVTQLNASVHQMGFKIMSNIAKPSATSSSERMLHSNMESHRRKGLQQLLSTPEENLQLLDGLAAQRNALARCLGAASYAEYCLDGATLAGAPEAVVTFLEELNSSLQPQLADEMQQLRRMKELHSGRDSRRNPLRPWDQHFCRQLAKADINAKLRGYKHHFSVKGILEGLAEILGRSLRVRLETVPLDSGETWAENLLKLSLSHEEEGPLGHVYLDLFRRPGKFASAAHFTLRSRRAPLGGAPQLPCVALAFNFGSLLLEPAEAETLFHEFGHALHSLLSRTQFQHLAGTRGPLDMIEIPSHFFEHFIRDPECLMLCTRDAATGARLPDGVAQAFRDSLDFMPALKLNESITYAMMDQRFHGHQAGDGNQSAAMADVVERLSAFHPVPDPLLHWHIRLGHLVSYGASYYSYVYAKFIADAVWEQHFRGRPLAPEAGTLSDSRTVRKTSLDREPGARESRRDSRFRAGAHVRTKLLDLGGAREPKPLVDDLIGPGSLRSIGGGWAPVVHRGRL